MYVPIDKVNVKVALVFEQIFVVPLILAVGNGLTVKVTEVAGPSQVKPLLSVTKTTVVLAIALLNPSWAFVGVVPVVNTVVRPASLYHV